MNLEKEHIMPAGHCPLGIYSHRRRNSHLYIIIFATDRFGNSTCLAIAEFRLFGKHYIPGVELFFHFKIHMDPLGIHIFCYHFLRDLGENNRCRLMDFLNSQRCMIWLPSDTHSGSCVQWCSTNIMLMIPEGWHTQRHMLCNLPFAAPIFSYN